MAADVAGLERAVEEVCVNALEHGFEPGQAGSLDVSVLRRPAHIVAAVEDQGRPFDFAALEAGKGSGLAEPSLMAFADTVSFAGPGRRGDRVEIGKRPLSHPGAGQFCAALETLGFFFAGVIPDLAGDDVLRLQYLNAVEADVESAQIASEFGKELFAYVVQAMDATRA